MTQENAGSGSLLGQAWLVLVLALCFGSALAAVEITLRPRILENKRNETFGQIPSLVPGASQEHSVEEVVGGLKLYHALSPEKQHLGWVAPAAGQGFADRIELLIGLNADATRITGIYVLDQKETPGLGDFITHQERFRRYFENQPATGELRVIKEEPEAGAGQIKALTGATISSDSVTAIVNRRVLEVREALAGRHEQRPGVEVPEITGHDTGA